MAICKGKFAAQIHTRSGKKYGLCNSCGKWVRVKNTTGDNNLYSHNRWTKNSPGFNAD